MTAGTGTGGELFAVLNNTTGAMTISAVIADNGGPVSLVKSGTGTASLIISGANTYSGGTFVDSGTLTLSTPSADGLTTFAVPGNLTINNGAAVTETLLSEIAQTSNVTINGGGTLTLTGANTLASATFNGNGGTATPTLTIGTTSLALTAANAITAVNNNDASTPTISGTLLNLTNPSPVINVSGLSTNDLVISAPIGTLTTGNVFITGGGSVVLSGASTFTAGVTLDANTSIIFAAASAGTPPAITGGPVGTGTLTLTGGSTLLSGTAVETIGNATTVNGSFTFGGTLAVNGVTLSGAMNLGSSSPTITVTSPLVTDTISGAITSTAPGTAFTKAGAGTLLISGNNGTSLGTGTVVVAGGVLQLGSTTAIGATNGVQINAGAVLNTGTFSASIGSLSGDSSATGGMVTNSSATLTTLTIGGDNATQTFAGIITSATLADLAIKKTGTGTQSLSGANTYTGATTVSQGTLNLIGNASYATLGGTTVTVSGGATLLASGNTSIGTTGAGSVVLSAGSGGGTLSLQDGTINTFTFNNNTAAATNLTFGAGTNLSLDINSSLSGASAVDLVNVTQKVGDNATSPIVNLNDLNSGGHLATGTTYVLMNYATSTGLANFEFSNLSTTEQAGMGYAYTLTTTTTQLQLNSAQNPTPSTIYWTGAQNAQSINWGYLANPSNASNWSTNLAGTSDPNQIPGSTTTVNFAASNAFVSGGAVTSNLAQSFSIAGLNFLGSSPVSTNTVVINSSSNSDILTIGSGGITMSSGSAGATINAPVALGISQAWNLAGGTTLTVDGGISGTGMALTVNTSGAGTLVLNDTLAANSFTGGTVINGGIVDIFTATSLGNGGTTTINNGTLEVSANINATRAFVLGSTGSTISVDGGMTYTITGGISGASGMLNATGAGKLVLNDASPNTANSFGGGSLLSGGGIVQIFSATSLGLTSGTATINAATLEVSANINAGRAFVLGSASSTISVDGGSTYTITGGISGVTGMLNATGAGILSLNDSTTANSFGGGSTISGGGTVQVYTATSLGASSGTAAISGGTVEAMNSIDTSRSFTLAGASNYIYVTGTYPTTIYQIDGTISNGASTGTLNVNGTGALALTGSNTYSGGTFVTSGVLDLDPAAGPTHSASGTGDVTLSGTGVLATTMGDTIAGNL
ncbi:MAG TPA: autotransporter-associated beta strand repeat-containing protein, partial [Pirellulales bacterium]